jgi:hypothetical protein
MPSWRNKVREVLRTLALEILIVLVKHPKRAALYDIKNRIARRHRDMLDLVFEELINFVEALENRCWNFLHGKPLPS